MAAKTVMVNIDVDVGAGRQKTEPRNVFENIGNTHIQKENHYGKERRAEHRE